MSSLTGKFYSKTLAFFLMDSKRSPLDILGRQLVLNPKALLVIYDTVGSQMVRGCPVAQ